MENEILDDQLDFKSKPIDQSKIKEINLIKIEANELISFVKGGRAALLALSGLVVFGTIYSLYVDLYGASPAEVIMEGVVLMIIYLICAWGVTKNAKASFLTALGVYLLMQLLIILIAAGSVFSGILLKVIIIFYLGRALHAAFGLDKLYRKLISLGVSSDEIHNAKLLIDFPKTTYNANA